MSTVTVPNRPFSADLFTGLMLPDGLFEKSLGRQRLNTHFKNVGAAAVPNVTVFLESTSDPGIVVSPVTHLVGNLDSGVATLASWIADFTNATPGVHFVSFVIKSNSTTSRVIKKIFVTAVSFDPTTKTFSANAPEGTIEVRFKDLIVPKRGCCGGGRRHGRREKSFTPTLFNDVGRLFIGHAPDFKFCPLGFPHNFEVVVTPNPSFDGQYGDLPFQDPWWKLFLLLFAALLAIIGAIVNAVTGDDPDPSTVTVGPNDQGDCCQVEAEGGSSNYVAAGLYAAAAAAAVAAAASDERDPFRRGQDNTIPAPGEITTAERLDLSINYVEPVALGKPFAVGAKWEYTRITTGATYTYSVNETNTNIHALSSYKVTAQNVIRLYKEEPFVVRAEFFDQDGNAVRAESLFVQCFLAGPQGQFRSFVLQDNGSFPDETASDGVYTGVFQFAFEHNVDPRGVWMFYVIAQDINTAQPNMKPEDQAKIIGGMVLTNQLTVSFEGGTCPLVPDGHVNVI